MSNLEGFIKDLVSKKLSDAQQKINDTLQAKALEKIDSMRPEVGKNLLRVEEELEYDGEEEDVEEGLAPVKKRIDPAKRREAAKYYRTNKVKIKQQQKKYRKSAQGRRTAVKAKRFEKVGKTSTGKRKSQILNKRLTK